MNERKNNEVRRGELDREANGLVEMTGHELERIEGGWQLSSSFYLGMIYLNSQPAPPGIWLVF